MPDRRHLGHPSRRRDHIAVGAAEYRALRAEQLPALLVATAGDAELMIEKWGMLRYADVISRETREVLGGDRSAGRAVSRLRQR